jgi:tRNA-specific adenosine deaminase 1
MCDSSTGNQWTGYHSLVYEIPVSSEFDGVVNLQSLVRRIARAIVHFMNVNDP